MEMLRNTDELLASALELHRKGLRLVPLRGKHPLVKGWPALHLSEQDIRDWSRSNVNWGAVSGVDSQGSFRVQAEDA